MTPEQLKASILQYAMEGKLVKQDPNDDPASELLKKIKTEKSQLIKEKKIKATKKLPDITDDEKPFEIPDSWEWVRLQDVCKLIKAGGDKPKKISKVKQSTITVPIYSNGITNNGLYGYTDIAAIKAPAITISARGTIGYSVVRNEDFYPIVRLICISVINTSRVSLSFLKAYFDSAIISGEGTSIQQLTVPKIKPMLIPFPPIEEQKRIVAKIEQLLPLVEQYAKTYNRLQEIDNNFNDKMKQSILQYAMEGKLIKQDSKDEPASELLKKIKAEKAQLIKEKKIKATKKSLEVTQEEIPFEIPNSWEWIRFGDLVYFNLGKTPKRTAMEYWTRGEIPWISIADMKTPTLSETKEKVTAKAVKDVFKNKIVSKGTLLMSFKLSIGKVGILKTNAVHNEAIIDIYPFINEQHITRNYLFTFLPVISNAGDFKKAIKGKTLNKTSLNNMLIPLPPLEEQKRIVAKIDLLFQKI